MNRIKSIFVAASVSFALVLTFSCSSDDTSEGGVSFNENSQIYDGEEGTVYTGSGIIEVAYRAACWGGYDDSGCDWAPSLHAGSVTNGIVNLELPTDVPDEYLTAANEYFSGCTVYSEDIKMFGGVFVLTDNNRELIGSLRIGYRDEQVQERISYLYFSKAGKLTCNSEDEEDGYKYKEIINIDAKVGWNKVYTRTLRRETSRETEYTTSNILTKEMKWLYSSMY